MSTSTNPSMIGGPGTCLPRFVESALSWMLCISCMWVWSNLRRAVRVCACVSTGIAALASNGVCGEIRCPLPVARSLYLDSGILSLLHLQLRGMIPLRHYNCTHPSPSIPSHLEKAGLGVSGYYYLKSNLLPRLASFLARSATSIIGQWVTHLLTVMIYPNEDARARVALRKKNDDDDAAASTSRERYSLASSCNTDTSKSFSTLSYVPLTTASRRELRSKFPAERMDQLVRYLDHIVASEKLKEGDAKNVEENAQSSSLPRWTGLSDESFVELFRSDETCRRLASLAMRPPDDDDDDDRREGTLTRMTNRGGQHFDAMSFLSGRLVELWPRILALPPLGRFSPDARGGDDDGQGSVPDDDAVAPSSPSSSPLSFPYRISLIMPAFREDGDQVRRRLHRARVACTDPTAVEVLLVDADGCTNLDRSLSDRHDDTLREVDDATSSATTQTNVKSWGSASVHRYTGGGGRGPCLNYGANLASGQLLTFLHSDTSLPVAWDAKVIETLLHVDPRSGIRANSCAFSFGIDCTHAGLNGGAAPPGIRAVQTTANWRTHVYSLPYGDQALSVPTAVFRHLGGFPDQCLMEDYELVDLLRRRATISSSKLTVDGSNNPMIAERERVAIVDGPPALCSPRRWQKCGVLYVTFMNSKFVRLYKGGMGPDELFKRYYGADPPARATEYSGWESDLQDVLVQKASLNQNHL